MPLSFVVISILIRCKCILVVCSQYPQVEVFSSQIITIVVVVMVNTTTSKAVTKRLLHHFWCLSQSSHTCITSPRACCGSFLYSFPYLPSCGWLVKSKQVWQTLVCYIKHTQPHAEQTWHQNLAGGDASSSCPMSTLSLCTEQFYFQCKQNNSVLHFVLHFNTPWSIAN